MNGNSKFAVFYVAVISVALGGSLFANILNPPWNHVVFTFPPETQKVVNGTAVMEIRWRWFPETLEMIVKVNDDDCNETLIQLGYNAIDYLSLLFDSDNNGKLTGQPGKIWETWRKDIDDHGVFISADNISAVGARCLVVYDYIGVELYYNGSVSSLSYWMLISAPHEHPDFIAYLNNCYYTYRASEGYTFKLTIPKELIKVEPSTSIHLSFTDSDVVWRESHSYHRQYPATIFADFEG